jgi:hemerythrin-like domain-containing protein
MQGRWGDGMQQQVGVVCHWTVEGVGGPCVRFSRGRVCKPPNGCQGPPPGKADVARSIQDLGKEAPMNPLQTLMDEHRVIERVLDAMEQFLDRCYRTAVADCQTELLRFVDFIQNFADKCHHGKEEDILFAEMVKAGFPREAGPLGVMLHEHDQGRAFVRELKRLGTQKGPWTDGDREELSTAASGYIGLLRQHISKEDGVLYPMAESQLPADAMRSISQRFREFEQNQAGASEQKRLRRLADELAGRYLDSTAR